jgi:tetratricopeptide (TPR) repeat protein
LDGYPSKRRFFNGAPIQISLLYGIDVLLCEECGNHIEATWKFCPNCNHKIIPRIKEIENLILNDSIVNLEIKHESVSPFQIEDEIKTADRLFESGMLERSKIHLIDLLKETTDILWINSIEYKLANILYEEKAWERAEIKYLKCLDFYESEYANEQLDNLKLQDKLWFILFYLGEIMFNKRQYNHAAEYFLECFQRYKGSQRGALALLRLAESTKAQEDFESTLTNLDMCIQSCKEHDVFFYQDESVEARAYLLRGILLQSEGYIEESEKSFKECYQFYMTEDLDIPEYHWDILSRFDFS